MKLHYDIKLPLILCLLLTMGTTGCLKDKEFDDGSIQSTHGSGVKVISLGINVATSDNYSALAISNSSTDTVIQAVPVELGGPVSAPQDIHVTLEQVDSLVDNLNAANDASGNGPTDLTVPTAFSIVDPVVVIPKGSRVGFLQLKFVPSDLIGVNNAIGFVVKSIAESGYTISGNLGKGVIGIIIKNQFDGTYNLRMKTLGWEAYGIDDVAKIWPAKVTYESTGTYSNVINANAGVGTLQPGFSGGAITAFGATEPQYTIDPVSFAVTSVVNLVPDDGRGRVFALNPAVTDSRYDPVTKTIYIAYLLKQNGRPNMQIYDTLTYVGPR